MVNTDSIKLPGRPRSEQSKDSILTAAFDLLREVGFDRMSIDAVAARAGVGKATIYRWYKSKEDLVVDALTCKKSNAPAPNKGSLAGDMEALVQAAVDADPMSFDRQSCALTISALAGSERLAQIYWTQHVQPRRAVLQVIFTRAKERGELASDADPTLFFDLVHGSLLYNLLMKPGPIDLPRVTRTLVDQLLKGFGPQP